MYSNSYNETDRVCKKYNIKILYKPTTKLVLYFSNYKNNIPFDLQSNVMHEIQWIECDKTYWGETGRWNQQRMKERQREIQNMKVKNCVNKHFWETGHVPCSRKWKYWQRNKNGCYVELKRICISDQTAKHTTQQWEIPT